MMNILNQNGKHSKNNLSNSHNTKDTREAKKNYNNNISNEDNHSNSHKPNNNKFSSKLEKTDKSSNSGIKGNCEYVLSDNNNNKNTNNNTYVNSNSMTYANTNTNNNLSNLQSHYNSNGKLSINNSNLMTRYTPTDLFKCLNNSNSNSFVVVNTNNSNTNESNIIINNSIVGNSSRDITPGFNSYVNSSNRNIKDNAKKNINNLNNNSNNNVNNINNITLRKNPSVPLIISNNKTHNNINSINKNKENNNNNCINISNISLANNSNLTSYINSPARNGTNNINNNKNIKNLAFNNKSLNSYINTKTNNQYMPICSNSSNAFIHNSNITNITDKKENKKTINSENNTNNTKIITNINTNPSNTNINTNTNTNTYVGINTFPDYDSNDLNTNTKSNTNTNYIYENNYLDSNLNYDEMVFNNNNNNYYSNKEIVNIEEEDDFYDYRSCNRSRSNNLNSENNENDDIVIDNSTKLKEDHCKPYQDKLIINKCLNINNSNDNNNIYDNAIPSPCLIPEIQELDEDTSDNNNNSIININKSDNIDTVIKNKIKNHIPNDFRHLFCKNNISSSNNNNNNNNNNRNTQYHSINSLIYNNSNSNESNSLNRFNTMGTKNINNNENQIKNKNNISKIDKYYSKNKNAICNTVKIANNIKGFPYAHNNKNNRNDVHDINDSKNNVPFNSSSAIRINYDNISKLTNNQPSNSSQSYNSNTLLKAYNTKTNTNNTNAFVNYSSINNNSNDNDVHSNYINRKSNTYKSLHSNLSYRVLKQRFNNNNNNINNSYSNNSNIENSHVNHHQSIYDHTNKFNRASYRELKAKERCKENYYKLLKLVAYNEEIFPHYNDNKCSDNTNANYNNTNNNLINKYLNENESKIRSNSNGIRSSSNRRQYKILSEINNTNYNNISNNNNNISLISSSTKKYNNPLSPSNRSFVSNNTKQNINNINNISTFSKQDKNFTNKSPDKLHISDLIIHKPNSYGFFKNILTIVNHNQYTSAFRENGKLKPPCLIETNKRLIPLPIPKYIKLRNLDKLEFENLIKAKQTTVQQRRIQYGLKPDNNQLTLEDIVYLTTMITRIQKFWRVFLIKKCSIIIIQTKIRQFLAKQQVRNTKSLINVIGNKLNNLELIIFRLNFRYFFKQPAFKNTYKLNNQLAILFMCLENHVKKKVFITLKKQYLIQKYFFNIIRNKEDSTKRLFLYKWRYINNIISNKTRTCFILCEIDRKNQNRNKSFSIKKIKNYNKNKKLFLCLKNKFFVSENLLKNCFYKLKRSKDLFILERIKHKLLRKNLTENDNRNKKIFFDIWKDYHLKNKIFEVFFKLKFKNYIKTIENFSFYSKKRLFGDFINKLNEFGRAKKEKLDLISQRTAYFTGRFEFERRELINKQVVEAIMRNYCWEKLRKLFFVLNLFCYKRKSNLSNNSLNAGNSYNDESEFEGIISQGFKEIKRYAYKEQIYNKFSSSEKDNDNNRSKNKQHNKYKFNQNLSQNKDDKIQNSNLRVVPSNTLSEKTPKINSHQKLKHKHNNPIFTYINHEIPIIIVDTSNTRYQYQFETQLLNKKLQLFLKKPKQEFIRQMKLRRQLFYLARNEKSCIKNIKESTFPLLKHYYKNCLIKEQQQQKLLKMLKKNFYHNLNSISSLINKVRRKEKGYYKVLGFIKNMKARRYLLIIKKWKLFIDVKKQTYSEYMSLYDDLWNMYKDDLDKETKIEISQLQLNGNNKVISNINNNNNKSGYSKMLGKVKEAKNTIGNDDNIESNINQFGIINIFSDAQNYSKLNILSEFNKKMIKKFSHATDSQRQDIGSSLITGIIRSKIPISTKSDGSMNTSKDYTSDFNNISISSNKIYENDNKANSNSINIYIKNHPSKIPAFVTNTTIANESNNKKNNGKVNFSRRDKILEE